MKDKTTVKPVNNNIATNQLWYGENQSLLSVELAHWVDLFRAKYTGAEVKRFEYSEANESELTVALHQAVNGGSLFTKKVFLIIYNALSAELKSEFGNLIQQACGQKSADYVLVLVENKKVAWSKPLPKALKKIEDSGTLKLKEYLNLSLIDLEKWIVTRVREEGGKFAPQAVRQLAQSLNNDFFALSNEISKLIAWRSGEEVCVADVDLFVAPKLVDDVFAFIDAVGRRDIPQAQATLARQFEQGTSPQSLIGLLAWHVRVLALVRQALDNSSQRAAARELATELGLHPFVVTKTLQQIPYYSAEKISWLYSELSDLDIKLKSTRTDPQVLFGMFLSKLSTLRLGA